MCSLRINILAASVPVGASSARDMSRLLLLFFLLGIFYDFHDDTNHDFCCLNIEVGPEYEFSDHFEGQSFRGYLELVLEVKEGDGHVSQFAH